MHQYGVAALEKDMPFPADCVLSWNIWVALNPQFRLDTTLTDSVLQESDKRWVAAQKRQALFRIDDQAHRTASAKLAKYNFYTGGSSWT
jgi:hypothetical protein